MPNFSLIQLCKQKLCGFLVFQSIFFNTSRDNLRKKSLEHLSNLESKCCCTCNIDDIAVYRMSMESTYLALPPTLPRSPSINVGKLEVPAEDMVRINIARGERGNIFCSEKSKCSKTFFADCLWKCLKKSTEKVKIHITFVCKAV